MITFYEWMANEGWRKRLAAVGAAAAIGGAALTFMPGSKSPYSHDGSEDLMTQMKKHYGTSSFPPVPEDQKAKKPAGYESEEIEDIMREFPKASKQDLGSIRKMRIIRNRIRLRSF